MNNFCAYHPNGAVAVAPEWVVACLQNKHIVEATDYPPTPRVGTLQVKKKKIKSQQKKGADAQIFGDSFFHILSPTSTKSRTNVLFEFSKFEELIQIHGGRLLSRDGIRLLQNNGGANTTSRHNVPKNTTLAVKRKRIPKCYLVHLTGPFNLETTLKGDALLKHIYQQNLCNIVPVNPIWLQTCDMNKTEINPREHAELFIPQQMPLRLIPESIRLKIAVTGFMGIERTGMRNMLVSIGAIYTDNMSGTNTHLICKEAVGPKFRKAVEWNLHVVTVGWLHHVCYRGYEIGCENKFSLLRDKKTGEKDNSQSTTILSSQEY